MLEAIAALLAAGYPIVIGLVLRHLRVRDEAERRERQSLLQRIQAPEQAVIDSAEREIESFDAVGFENDEEYWEAKGVVS